MKNPNGYGSVIKLSGKRRKPWAVRISSQINTDEGFKQKYRYIGYYEKREQALTCLAEYNSGHAIKEHKDFINQQKTFAEVYELWKEYRLALPNKITDNTWRNYNIAYNQLSEMHLWKFDSIDPKRVQLIINGYSSKSKSTLTNMRIILKSVCEYAVMESISTNNFSIYLKYAYSNPEEEKHIPFTDDEIKMLWDNEGRVNNVDILLILIYTGMRPTELLEMKSENVHLDEKYMIGGSKTTAGRNRIIPIHDKIYPLIHRRLMKGNSYLITNKNDVPYARFNNYMASNFNTIRDKLKLNHVPYDCRHTFATLSDRYGLNEYAVKEIMGHAIKDVTKGVYTHKDVSQLLEQINKIAI